MSLLLVHKLRVSSLILRITQADARSKVAPVWYQPWKSSLTDEVYQSDLASKFKVTSTSKNTDLPETLQLSWTYEVTKRGSFVIGKQTPAAMLMTEQHIEEIDTQLEKRDRNLKPEENPADAFMRTVHALGSLEKRGNKGSKETQNEADPDTPRCVSACTM